MPQSLLHTVSRHEIRSKTVHIFFDIEHAPEERVRVLKEVCFNDPPIDLHYKHPEV